MASAEFDEKSEEKRPTVQVGDPFTEKLLLEACLELFKGDALVGIQDMGAAGLTCSTAEMGSRGGAGIDIDVAHVPQRESGMTPYETMLSESQERMLLVVKQGREHEVERVFEKWDLHAVKIGTVTADGMLRVRSAGEIVAEIPNRALTDEAPVYRRPVEPPAYLDEARVLDLDRLQPGPNAGDALLALLSSPTIASKQWVYRQYDHMVRTNTINLPGIGAGVVRVKGTSRALAMSVDGNGRYCYLDPQLGAMLAVAEAARNVACTGARPLAATNCLNFGNPQRPAIMWQFAKAVEGIGTACRALGVPITGGNVSLYNETDGTAVLPTPVIGVVGLLERAEDVLDGRFRAAGDVVILLGQGRGDLGGSEYLNVVHGMTRGTPPALDLGAERALQQLLVALADAQLLHSAHDCSDGGLAVTVAECCFGSDGHSIGADVAIDGVAVAANVAINEAAALFGETASRVVVSAAPEAAAAVMQQASRAGVPAAIIGQTGGDRLRIAVQGRSSVNVSLQEAYIAWSSSLERRFSKRVA
jgi:phosphoribosylformylglycinamidine synthase